MKIEAYLCMWNELDMVKLVVSHYQKFCDRVIILDNHSTDGSDKLAESLGCEVIKFGTKFFDDQENMNIKNNCWKGSDADWVIVADFDEILISEDHYGVSFGVEDFSNFIKYYTNGASIIKTIGWQIMSDSMPQHDLLEITNGYRFDNYSKNIIFNPKRIKEINYNPGAHKIDPVGDVVYSEDSLYVLHYKHIGGVQRTIDRYKEYKPRMSKNNRQRGWGVHYSRSEQSIREEWNQRMAISKPLI
jgi:glycosyl transferase family 2